MADRRNFLKIRMALSPFTFAQGSTLVLGGIDI